MSSKAYKGHFDFQDLQAQLISLEKEGSLASVDEHFKKVLVFQVSYEMDVSRLKSRSAKASSAERIPCPPLPHRVNN